MSLPTSSGGRLAPAAIQQVYSQLDAVHVLNSLTCFEALLRGVEVHTWGLTHDIPKCERRQRQRSLDELLAWRAASP